MINNIRIQRSLKKVTQEKMAKELGITRQAIHAMENNRYRPALLLACRIAFYFGKRVDEIFFSEYTDIEDIVKAKESRKVSTGISN